MGRCIANESHNFGSFCRLMIIATSCTYILVVASSACCVVGGMTDVISSGTLLGFYGSHMLFDDDS